MPIEIKELNAHIATADTAALSAMSSEIANRQAAIIEARNAGLADFVVLTALTGSKGLIEVSRAKAIELLNAGTHAL